MGGKGKVEEEGEMEAATDVEGGGRDRNLRDIYKLIKISIMLIA